MVASTHMPWLVWDMAQWAICKLGNVMKTQKIRGKRLSYTAS